MKQRFTIDPDPPQAGQPVKICYEFTGTPLTETEIKIDWRPDTIPDESHAVTPADPCVTVTVPAGASGGFLIDTKGYSDDRGFLVD